MASRSKTQWQTLEGTVKNVVFRDADGYAVVRLQVADQLLPVTVVGKLVTADEGIFLRVRGHWKNHKRFGPQFTAVGCESTFPETEEGMIKYLGSGSIDGVGPSLARRLIDAFGNQVFSVAQSDPLLLMQIPGIGKHRAKKIANSLAEKSSTHQAMIFLQSVGIGPSLAARILRKWGRSATDRVKRDPYMLIESIEGIGFLTADAIAKRIGIEHNDPARLRGGLRHIVLEARDRGDTVVARDVLVEHAASFLQVDIVAVERELAGMLDKQIMVKRDDTIGDEVLGLAHLVRAEERIADRLQVLLQQKKRKVPTNWESTISSIELTDEQRGAIQKALESPVMIITGGPGTGKTTILMALVRLLSDLIGENTILCAPTGRAAKRMTESAGIPAATVHRLLGYRRGEFLHGTENPLPEGTVIVDESSMLDIHLTQSLLDALRPQSRLIFVGDADQLPSVGPGNVLADMLDSKKIPAARLTKLFRQAESSPIVANAHRIRCGETPIATKERNESDGEFHIIAAEDPQKVQDLVADLCVSRIPKAFGFDSVDDIQVLAPMHRGTAGTEAFNLRLQSVLNPNSEGLQRGSMQFCVGDKVMQVKNDYDRDVFNGDIGRVRFVDREKDELIVHMHGIDITYTSQQLQQLNLAYCVSIHKSQGSEYPAVVLPLLKQHYVLLQRNLLYTAVTRARQLVVVVGSRDALRIAVQRADQGQRRTQLRVALDRHL